MKTRIIWPILKFVKRRTNSAGKLFGTRAPRCLIRTVTPNGSATKIKSHLAIKYFIIIYLGSIQLIYFSFKAKFLIKKRLGGAFIDALSYDDFSGRFCNQGTYPLIRYFKEELYRIKYE